MQWRIWLAVFVLFMAFWKGDSGYLDLQEQLDDAVNLWTYGDLRVRARDGTPIEPVRYNRYAYGPAIFSGPLVLAGRALKFLFGDGVQLRAMAALFVPAAGALGALFVYRLSRELNASHRTAFFTMLIFAIGGLLLSQSRLFYTEAPFAACMLAALMWSLEAGREKSVKKAFIAGCALGCAVLLHATAFILTFPALGIIAIHLWRQDLRFRAVIAAAAPAIIGFCGMLALNAMRYGHPLKSGYDYSVVVGENILAPKLFVEQAGLLSQLPLRVLWLVPAFCFLFSRAARKDDRFLLSGLAIVLVSQWIFWTSFYGLQMFPLRYFGPSLALAAPGLCLFLMFLEQRGERAWAYTVLGLLAAGVILNLRGDDGQPPLVPAETGLRGNFWFAIPETPRATDAPLGLMQWSAFAGLLIAAIALLRWAYTSKPDVLINRT